MSNGCSLGLSSLHASVELLGSGQWAASEFLSSGEVVRRIVVAKVPPDSLVASNMNSGGGLP